MQQLYVGAMDAIMKQKIEAALDRVKEPESGLSIAQLGLVEKLRYSMGKTLLSHEIKPVGVPGAIQATVALCVRMPEPLAGVC